MDQAGIAADGLAYEKIMGKYIGVGGVCNSSRERMRKRAQVCQHSRGCRERATACGSSGRRNSRTIARVCVGWR